MLEIEVSGLEEARSVLLRMTDGSVSANAIAFGADEFKRVISEATPEGYSRRLPRSVSSQIDGDSALVGYEPGVEVAGNPEFDSVVRPQTQGESVLRQRRWTPKGRRNSVRRDRRKWVSVNELESVLQEAASFAGDRVTAAAGKGALSGIS
jgi:hypothetical protein